MKKTVALLIAVFMVLSIAPGVLAVGKMTADSSKAVKQSEFAGINARTKEASLSMGFEPTEDMTGWMILDADGDTHQWEIDTLSPSYEGNSIRSDSSFEDDALTPDNWLISPKFTVKTDDVLTWVDVAQDPRFCGDNYSVYIAPGTADEAADFTEVLYSGTPEGIWTVRSISLTTHAGQEVRIAFRHHDVTDMFALKLDNIRVGNEPVEINPNKDLGEALNVEDGTYKFYDIGVYAWEKFTEDERVIARSTNSGMDDSSGGFYTKIDLKAGTVLKFDYNVDSEEEYDNLVFYVNDVVKDMFSGEIDWTTYQYVISKDDTYTFKWMYEKDDSYNEGDDDAWVDNICTEALPVGANLDDVINVKDGQIKFNNFGDYSWVIDGTAAKSSNVGMHSTDSSFSANITLNPGEILSFDFKVSSEEYFDELKFYDGKSVVWAASGEQDWQTVCFINEKDEAYSFLATWEYAKDNEDDNGDNCDDAAWIDNVYAGPSPVLTGIAFETKNIILTVGKSVAPSILPLPELAVLSNVTFEVADATIAEVKDGAIVGLKVGETTVTAKSAEGFVATIPVKIVEDVVAYGNVIYGADTLGWNQFDLMMGEVDSCETDMNIEELSVAEYFDGIVYGVTEDGEFYKMDCETGHEILVDTDLDTDLDIRDMTYNYADKTMYVMCKNMNGETERASEIYSLNLTTGDTKKVCTIDAESISNYFITFACNLKGEFYGITMGMGDLYKIDLTGKATLVGNTGMTPLYLQSMSFDHNTEKLYWAYTDDHNDGEIYEVDVATGDVKLIMDSVGEVCALYFEYMTAPETLVNVSGVTLDVDTVRLDWGEKIAVKATVAPENATDKRIDWETSNNAVATVSKHGMVKVVGRGVATITARTRDGGFEATARIISSYDVEFALKENFEGPLKGWTIIDADDDGNAWELVFNGDERPYSGYGCYASASWSDEDEEDLDPDNWLISPVVGVKSGAVLSWFAEGYDDEDYAEHYSVYVGSATATEPKDFTKIVYDGTTTADWTQYIVNLSAFAGQQIRIAFRHHDVTDMYWLRLDSVSVSSIDRSGPQIGDVNNDKLLNTGDAVVVLTKIVSNEIITDEQRIIFDINGDRLINTGDAVVMLRMAVDAVK